MEKQIKIFKHSDSFLSKTEKMINRKIIANPNIVIKNTISELSTEIGTIPSAISRYVRKIGFPTYADFKLYIMKQLELYNSILYKNYNDEIEKIIEVNNSLMKIALDETAKNLISEDFKRLIDEIDDYDCIFIYGTGSSYLAADELCFQLLKIGFNVIDDPSSKKIIEIIKSKKDQKKLVIMFSHLAETSNVSSILDSHFANTKICLITSPLANSNNVNKADYLIRYGMSSLEENYNVSFKVIQMYCAITIKFLLENKYRAVSLYKKHK